MNEVDRVYDFYFWEDYRGHSGFHFVEEELKSTKVENSNLGDHIGIFSIPIESENVRRLYLFEYEEGKNEIKVILVGRNIENGLHQLHSHINKCGLFVKTGEWFKNEGYYDKPILVTNANILQLDDNYYYEKPTVALEVDQDANILDFIGINPFA
jgi:hypothetical protein